MGVAEGEGFDLGGFLRQKMGCLSGKTGPARNCSDHGSGLWTWQGDEVGVGTVFPVPGTVEDAQAPVPGWFPSEEGEGEEKKTQYFIA